MEKHQIFISYRRDGGGDLAGRLKDRFTALGYKVFFDHESLDSGIFNTQILDAIFACNDFLLVLPPDALDRCENEKDWVRQELACAIKNRKNIIPIMMNGFSFPDSLPEEIDLVRNLEGVPASAEYFDAVILRIEKMLHSKTQKKEPANPLLDAIVINLEYQEWEEAEERCVRVIDQSPRCAQAYLAKLLVELKCSFEADLENQSSAFEENVNFKKALRFADPALRTKLEGYLAASKEREKKEILAVKMLENDTFSAKLQRIEDLLTAEMQEQSARVSAAKEEESVHTSERMKEEERCLADQGIVDRNNLQRLKWENRLLEIELLEKKLAEEKNSIRNSIAEGCKETDRLAREIAKRKDRVAELAKIEAKFSEKTKVEVDFLQYIQSEAECIAKFKETYDLPLTDVELISKKLEEGKTLLDGMVCAVDRIADLKRERDARIQEEKEQEERKKRSGIRGLVSGGEDHVVGSKTDGTVLAIGSNHCGQCNVEQWTDIVEVSAGDYHTVGLKKDGTVVATGYNQCGQCNVDGWTDIVEISTGNYHTVGLKKDGTVYAVGGKAEGQCDVGKWTDIVEVSAGGSHTVGLKKDGTVVAVGDNGFHQCDVQSWKDIVSIAAGDRSTLGIRSNGTVIGVGHYDSTCYEIANWRDIVTVAVGNRYSVGLKSDGTLVTTSKELKSCFSKDEWSDIVSVAVIGNRTVALKSDGSVITTDGFRHEALSEWNLID